jgi:hypothetical protein
MVMDELDDTKPLLSLRRQMRWLQVFVVVGFAGIGGALYWQARVIGEELADVQRPFVALKEGRFLPVTGTGQPAWQFVAVWENGGNTSAIDLQVQVSVWTGPGLQAGFTKSDASPNPTGALTLGPHTTVTIPDFTLPADALLGAKQSPGFIAIWGVARYREARGERPSHTMRFCNFVTWLRGDPARDTALDIRYNACREGNCTDETCVAQGYAK